jgi:hypothetical protein
MHLMNILLQSDDLLCPGTNTETDKDFQIYCNGSLSNYIFLDTVCEMEVIPEIRKLNNAKLLVPDGIGPKIIKNMSDMIIQPLAQSGQNHFSI